MASLDLRSLYEQEVDSVFSFLSRFGMPRADLEDAVHDTFLTALHRESSYDPARPARAWLLGIAFRVAVARLRKSHTAGAAAAAEPPPDARDPSQDPEAHVALSQARSVARRAIAELNDDQGAVFAMHDLQGVSIADISQAMGAPVATTYSRLRLARAAFAEAVKRIQGAAP